MDAGVDRDVGAAAPDAPSPIPDAQRGESPVLDAAGAVDQKLRDAAVADRPRDAAEIDLAPGAQPDARPTGCAARGPGVLLCEDFEKGLPPRDSVYGYATSANGSVTSESVVVHGGARAAEFRPGDNAGLSRYAVLYRTFTPPLTEGPLHVRFYVRVPADSTMPPWNVFFELVESDVAPGRIKLVQAPGDSITFEVSPGMQSATSSPNALKRDVWQCVQVIVNLSQTSTGRAEYLVDGETRQIISGVATVPTAGWAKVTVGSVTGPDATGVHLYLDDIVVSTQPVGCD